MVQISQRAATEWALDGRGGSQTSKKVSGLDTWPGTVSSSLDRRGIIDTGLAYAKQPLVRVEATVEVVGLDLRLSFTQTFQIHEWQHETPCFSSSGNQKERDLGLSLTVCLSVRFAFLTTKSKVFIFLQWVWHWK